MTDRLDRLAADALTAQVYPPILAIDPGSMHTGITLRVGVDAVEAATVTVQDDRSHHTSMLSNARRVVEVAHELIARNRDALVEIAAERGLADPPRVRVAIETQVPPTPAARAKGRRVAVAPTVLADLPGAAVVLGLVAEHWRQSILVPPLGRVTLHGTTVQGWDGVGEISHLAPATLQHHTRKGWLLPQPGEQQRKHQRSAWGIAGAAHVLTAAPLPAQAKSAARHAAAQEPRTDPEALVPVLRASIAATGAWDVWDRLPALARMVVKADQGQAAGDQAARAVEEYLSEDEDEDSEGDGHE